MREFFFLATSAPITHAAAADRALWAASRWFSALSLPGGARSLTGLRQAAGRSNLALIPTRASQVDRPWLLVMLFPPFVLIFSPGLRQSALQLGIWSHPTPLRESYTLSVQQVLPSLQAWLDLLS